MAEAVTPVAEAPSTDAVLATDAETGAQAGAQEQAARPSIFIDFIVTDFKKTKSKKFSLPDTTKYADLYAKAAKYFKPATFLQAHVQGGQVR